MFTKMNVLVVVLAMPVAALAQSPDWTGAVSDVWSDQSNWDDAVDTNGYDTEAYRVYRGEWGAPEAMWVIRVEDFPAVVTMDAHGKSIHDDIAALSKANYDRLISGE